MKRNLLIGFAAIALIAAAALFILEPWRSVSGLQIGMTERPCTPEGRPVTGHAIDDWGGLCVYRAANARLKQQGDPIQVVMIGDSLTDFWKEPGAGIVRRGIGGQTSGQVLLRFRQDVIALKPAIVHILVGTNDIAGNTGPNAPDMLLANLSTMVESAQANGIIVILGTVPPADRFPWRPRVETGNWVAKVNRGIADLASERSIVLADYHAMLARPDGSPDPALIHDGTHPSEAGYRKMEAILHKAIAKARRSVD